MALNSSRTCHSHTASAPPNCFLSPALQAKQQQHQLSLSRLKEQLHWCVQETEALKRQLTDKDAQLAQLRRGAALGGSRF
jgi:hypothetical protein